VRDEDHLGPLRSACFAGGLLALGSHAGELRLADAATGVTVAAADNEHTAAINTLRSWQASVHLMRLAVLYAQGPRMPGNAASCMCEAQPAICSVPLHHSRVGVCPNCRRTTCTLTHSLVSCLLYRAAVAVHRCCCRAAGERCGSGT